MKFSNLIHTFKLLFVVFYCCLLSVTTLSAQQQEIGSSFSHNYAPTDFKAHMQNWAIVQDKRGILYFANKDGVLEYDGATWHIIKVSRDVRSLAVDTDGVVYVGAIGDFGYLQPRIDGEMEFVSLLGLIDSTMRDFGDVWKVYSTPEGIWFQSYSWLALYKDKKLQLFYPSRREAFHFSFAVRNQIYITEEGVGLLTIENNQLKLAKGGEFFANERIYALLPYDTQRILVATRNLGLFIWNPDTGNVEKFITPLNDYLISNQIYHGIKLRNGNYVFATITGGAVVMNAAGETEQLINKQAFLQTESVYYVYNDRQNNLWLGLDNGISFVEVESPWQQWNETHGLKGIVYSIVRHEKTLYAATSQGVFYLQNNRFIQIEGIKGQTWDLISVPAVAGSYQSKLLVGNAVGVYAIDNYKATKLFAGSHAFKFFHSKRTPEKIYVGFNNSLVMLELEGNNVFYRGSLKEIEGEIRNITEDDEGNVLINIPFKGLCVISAGIENGRFIANDLVYIGEDKGFNSLESEVFILNGKLVFTNNKKLFHFNEQTGRFEENPVIDKYLNDGVITHLTNDKNGNIWFSMIHNVSKQEAIGVLRKDKDGKYIDGTNEFKRLPQMSIQEVYPEENGYIWIGGSSGLFRYNSLIPNYYITSYQTLIRKIYINEDSLLFTGNFLGKTTADGIITTATEQPEIQTPTLEYDYNEITFHFAAPYFTDEKQTLYSYYLENFDKNWSTWHTQTSREYTNLPEGSYTFHVKAKNIYGVEGKPAQFSFKILPPWYRSRWAYTLYVVGGLLLIWAFITWYTRKLKKEKDVLEQTVTERTAEINQKRETLERQTLEIMQQAENLRFLNEQLAHTNHELEEQKAEVEKKNEDIKASLNYAQRIQSAMLPDVQRMKQVFNDLFVLMMPRDIVSGDFYWYAEVRKHRLEEKMHHKIETRDVYETRNIQFAPDVREIQDFATVMGEDYVVPTGFQVLTRQTIITAADCTGHGVPGALMSMIGSNLLNEIVFMRGITEANEILSALSHGVRTFLKQDESKSKDGMDMALCMIDWDERKLYFSGAKNPLIYIQNGEVVEIKGDKKSIGGAATTTKEQKDGSSFALHTIDLKNTTHFYMMSDGYEDQFGGLEGKKFMRKNLRELILKIHNLSMSKQHQILKDNIIDWMKVGKQAQIDDILVVGFRIDELNPHK